MKTEDLLKITEEVDDIFHKHDYVIDHPPIPTKIYPT